MLHDIYHLSILIGCMALMMTLVVRGKSIFVVAPLCALIAVTFSGADPVAQMNDAYMTGFADYVKRFYLIFALGAVFGKIMDESGAAVSIARTVGQRLGKDRACCRASVPVGESSSPVYSCGDCLWINHIHDDISRLSRNPESDPDQISCRLDNRPVVD